MPSISAKPQGRRQKEKLRRQKEGVEEKEELEFHLALGHGAYNHQDESGRYGDRHFDFDR